MWGDVEQLHLMMDERMGPFHQACGLARRLLQGWAAHVRIKRAACIHVSCELQPTV